MKTEIFIAVSGGVVRCVRATKRPHRSDGYDCYIVDYDNLEAVVVDNTSEQNYEREVLDGRTWDEIEKTTVEVA